MVNDILELIYPISSPYILSHLSSFSLQFYSEQTKLICKHATDLNLLLLLSACLSAPPIAALGLFYAWVMMRCELLSVYTLRWKPHKYSGCGAEVSAYGVHGLSCPFSRGRHLHHASLNDVFLRSIDSAIIPCHLEPSGLSRSDGNRPDDASLVPWKGGKILVWDMTCPDILAPSCGALAVHEPGAVAAEAE